MKRLLSPFGLVLMSLLLLAGLFAAGWVTRIDPDEGPLIRVMGGSFIFNYRLADVTYGFTAVVSRPLESGSVIEAAFEDPSGGSPLLVRERVSPMTNRYVFQSPPVRGVEAGRPYRIDLKVFDRLGESVIWTGSLEISSDISDAVMPDAPLTVGPGYHRPPKGP